MGKMPMILSLIHILSAVTNDFTGKTVIPFCTSSSSGIGDSGQLLAALAGTGDWQEGPRFSSGVDEADVQRCV